MNSYTKLALNHYYSLNPEQKRYKIFPESENNGEVEMPILLIDHHRPTIATLAKINLENI